MLTQKEVSEYKTEIEQTLNRIKEKTNRIRSFTLFYLKSIMKSKGLTDIEIADCLSD